jgi:hypothetical protein
MIFGSKDHLERGFKSEVPFFIVSSKIIQTAAPNFPDIDANRLRVK